MSDFGIWLIEELRRKGWSQSELARRAGINQVTVSRIISEGRGVGPRVARKIACTLGLPEIEVFKQAGLLKGLPRGDENLEEYFNQRLPLISDEQRAALRQFLDHLVEARRIEREINRDLSVLDDENTQ